VGRRADCTELLPNELYIAHFCHYCRSVNANQIKQFTQGAAGPGRCRARYCIDLLSRQTHLFHMVYAIAHGKYTDSIGNEIWLIFAMGN